MDRRNALLQNETNDDAVNITEVNNRIVANQGDPQGEHEEDDVGHNLNGDDNDR